jgi:hypothetical protein
VPKGWNHSFLFLADRIALLSAEQPVLVVDLTKRRGARFALFPAKHGVSKNNLYSDRFKVTVVPLSDLPGQPSRAGCRATARGACASLHDVVARPLNCAAGSKVHRRLGNFVVS